VSAAEAVQAEAFRHALLVTADRICEAREELCDLDAAAGDGDLGATLATGFAAVRELVARLDGADPGAVLGQAGAQLARTAPSTIGTLLGMALMRAGRELADAGELDSAGVAVMLRAVAGSVADKGGARPGERTVLDAMDAAAGTAEQAAGEGLSARAALAQAADAAWAAAKATAEMEPRHGRAAWIPERARGTPDAGAVAWAIFVGGLAEGS
jgi:dihydroxyacetone kinase